MGCIWLKTNLFFINTNIINYFFIEIMIYLIIQKRVTEREIGGKGKSERERVYGSVCVRVREVCVCVFVCV